MNDVIDIAALRFAMKSQSVNQKELVGRSRISRAQISRILAQEVATVRRSTISKLASALQIEPSELTIGGQLRSFRQWVLHETAKIDFRGIGMPHFAKQPIEEVFVDLTVQEEPDLNGDDFLAEEDGSGKTPIAQPLSATKCIQTQDRVVVLGHPGGGKTTLVRSLAHGFAEPQSDTSEFPIYVRLPEFSRAQELDGRVDLVRFVAAKAKDAGCDDVEDALRQELDDQERRCILLLDGLDEVGDQKRVDQLVVEVRSLVERYPKNRFVITSRIVGFERAPWKKLGFSMFRIQGYNDDQLCEFVEKWGRLMSVDQGELQSAVFDNPRVRTLASNPLILTILMLLHGARGALPRRRVDLYEKIVDVFSDTWEKSKNATDKFDETHSIDMDAREFRWLLSDVSLAMQKAERTLAPRWWMAERIRDYLREKLGFEPDIANDKCDRIIRYLAERTGLIEERGLDLFGFSHRTLQEYFASLGIIDEADACQSRDVLGCLRGYLFHPQWCEVIRLIATQLTPPLAESLVCAILDDPDPVGRFVKRGTLLSLNCLADGATVANRRVLSQVFDSVKELGRSKWLGITLDMLDALKSLEGTRLDQQAKETRASILETATEELDLDDYKCLHLRVHLVDVFGKAEEKLCGFQEEAATDVFVKIGDLTHTVLFLNASLLVKNPDKWYESVCSIFEDATKSVALKQSLVRELGRRVKTDVGAEIRLRKVLKSNAPSSLRARAVAALDDLRIFPNSPICACLSDASLDSLRK
ncbi:MAG: NACHT domain-containing protein [Planctomycetes bacterium]|nr:NACHT domain-containing protein [Planctomycetota bacterium]